MMDRFLLIASKSVCRRNIEEYDEESSGGKGLYPSMQCCKLMLCCIHRMHIAFDSENATNREEEGTHHMAKVTDLCVCECV